MKWLPFIEQPAQWMVWLTESCYSQTGLKQQQYKCLCSLKQYLSGAPSASWIFKQKTLTLQFFFFLYATGRQHPKPPQNNRTEHHSAPKCRVIVCWTWTEANEMGETELWCSAERDNFCKHPKITKNKRRINEWVFEHKIAGFGSTVQAGGEGEPVRAS